MAPSDRQPVWPERSRRRCLQQVRSCSLLHNRKTNLEILASIYQKPLFNVWSFQTEKNRRRRKFSSESSSLPGDAHRPRCNEHCLVIAVLRSEFTRGFTLTVWASRCVALTELCCTLQPLFPEELSVFAYGATIVVNTIHWCPVNHRERRWDAKSFGVQESIK